MSVYSLITVAHVMSGSFFLSCPTSGFPALRADSACTSLLVLISDSIDPILLNSEEPT